ncbi:inhibitor of growth protein 3-like [Diadema setosum]|uniref:inhibitor of growth protein 3-like n=1 Tax=Diadema setosum TaxID=31175 RepID=UPI003B39FD0F
MLYLEDYLEMIEQLPMELKERFTEMREMDLQIQNSVDTLEDKVKKFFEAAKKLKPDSKQQQYETLRKEYYKLLDGADEKVQLANQVYDTVDRYLRKLDQEVSRFKMELEADHAGITEILERRSLELESSQKAQSGSSKSDKRKHALDNHIDKRVNADKLLSTLATNAAQDIASPRGSGLVGNSTGMVNSRDSAGANAQPTLSYMDNVGSSTAIAMAAAQAVSNTLQMQQGRRTASLKASYEAIKSGAYSGLGTLGRDFTYGSNSAASEGASSSSNKSSGRHRNKKHKSSSSSSSQQQQQQAVELPPLIEPLAEQPLDESSQSYDWAYDPNEPRYCVCNQVSYGEMVGCDNPKCPIEWFHYGCVGITNPPKGKWFCPQCTAAMKRREKKDVPSSHKHK